MIQETHFEWSCRKVFKITSQNEQFISSIQSLAEQGNWTAWANKLYLKGQEIFDKARKGNAAEINMHLMVWQGLMFSALNKILDVQTNPYSLTETRKGEPIIAYVQTWQHNMQALYNTKNLDSVLLNEIMILYSLSCHKRAGKRVYMVSDPLAEMLKNTEVRGVPSEDLRLPYPSVYIVVPETAQLKIWNEDTDYHTVKGIYITEDTIERAGVPTRGFRFCIVGTGNPNPRAEKMCLEDDAVIYFDFALPENTDLDDCLVQSDNYYNTNIREINKFGFGEQNAKLYKEIFKWTMNLLLYVTWTEPHAEVWIANETARNLWRRIAKLPKNSSKKEKLKEDYNKLNPMNRVYLGKSIVIKRGQQEERQPKEATKSTVHPALRILVSGHWRRQPYGPQHAQRKWIFIEPYWTNRGNSPFVKPHEVK